MKQKITTFSTYDGRAEEAVRHYTSIFRTRGSRASGATARPGLGRRGRWMTATFELCGQEFMALNGVMEAMLGMNKLEIDGLRKAYDGA